MKQHFKNKRRRNFYTEPTVIAAKEKYGRNKLQQNSASAPNAKNMWGVRNFFPTDVDGEDERTQNIHCQRLVDEFRCLPYQRRCQTIKVSMDMTFPVRRRATIEDSQSILDTMNKFPILADSTQVRLKC